VKYGWIITKDLLAEETLRTGEGDGFVTEVGVIGPSNIHPGLEARLANGEGLRFRMKDDDGEVMYEGRIVFEDHDIKVTRYVPFDGVRFTRGITDSVPEEGFGPLNDFGMPNAGCTSIEYWATGLGGGWLGL